MDDKYEEAIEWLREQDEGQGTYYEEVAGLIEELLGRVVEFEAKRQRQPEPTVWDPVVALFQRGTICILTDAGRYFDANGHDATFVVQKVLRDGMISCVKRATGTSFTLPPRALRPISTGADDGGKTET